MNLLDVNIIVIDPQPWYSITFPSRHIFHLLVIVVIIRTIEVSKHLDMLAEPILFVI